MKFDLNLSKRLSNLKSAKVQYALQNEIYATKASIALNLVLLGALIVVSRSLNQDELDIEEDEAEEDDFDALPE